MKMLSAAKTTALTALTALTLSTIAPGCGAPVPVGQVRQAEFTREDCSLYGFAKLSAVEMFDPGCMKDPKDPHGSGMTLFISAYFNCKKLSDDDIEFAKYTWAQCETGVNHPSGGVPSVSYGDWCIEVNGVCTIDPNSLPPVPLSIDPSTVQGQLLLALYDRIAQLQDRISHEGGPNLEMRMKLLTASELFVDLADAAYFNGDRIAALQAVSMAQRLLDLGLDFVPGVSFAKDAVTVVTGVNPITGETVSDVERTMLLAGLVAPAFISGATKGLVEVGVELEHVAASGRRSSSLAQELITVIGNSDSELAELSKLPPCVSSIARGSFVPSAGRGCRALGEISAEIAKTAEDTLEFLKSGKTGFGTAPRADYTKTFRQYFADVSDQVGQVHHAVEQQVLTLYPGVVTADEINSLENLRGVAKGAAGTTLHQSTIRKEWNAFYDSLNGRIPTKDELLAYAKIIDDKYGSQFIPAIR